MRASSCCPAARYPAASGSRSTRPASPRRGLTAPMRCVVLVGTLVLFFSRSTGIDIDRLSMLGDSFCLLCAHVRAAKQGLARLAVRLIYVLVEQARRLQILNAANTFRRR